MRKAIPASIFGPAHPDFAVLSPIETEILQRSGGIAALGEFFSSMLRDEIDELIDTPNTDRREYSKLEKVEKTYVGTRVEIRLRKFWGFPKGRLDLEINHVDVDVKHTMESGWMIPREAVGIPCVLTAADEITARCYMGLIVARREYLTNSPNQDKKLQIATPAWRNIRWLLFELPYPPNFWRNIDLATVGEIFEGRTGMERVRRLFRLVQDVPVPRKAVADAAQQLDPMKRVRKNGGARDQLWREGIALLSGKYHSHLIRKLGLPACGPAEFISHRLANAKERRLAEPQRHAEL